MTTRTSGGMSFDVNIGGGSSSSSRAPATRPKGLTYVSDSDIYLYMYIYSSINDQPFPARPRIMGCSHLAYCTCSPHCVALISHPIPQATLFRNFLGIYTYQGTSAGTGSVAFQVRRVCSISRVLMFSDNVIVST